MLMITYYIVNETIALFNNILMITEQIATNIGTSCERKCACGRHLCRRGQVDDIIFVFVLFFVSVFFFVFVFILSYSCLILRLVLRIIFRLFLRLLLCIFLCLCHGYGCPLCRCG